MTYDEALKYIHTISWRGSKRGLSRTVALLEKVGSPEKKLKFVHVAGTNGKGSTCACVESVLRTAGYKTGLYTSPYIARFNERIRVNGEDIPDDRLTRLVERVMPLAEEEEDKPTEFELITVLGLMYFVEEGCDIVVLEVGMGGEFDSTNVIPVPDVAVITALGLDHTKYLGPTIEDIAKAKAGIIKEGGDAVIYGGDCAADAVIERTCLERCARLHKADFSKLNVKSHSLKGCVFDFGQLKDIELPLAGAYQPYNASLAITILKVLASKGWNISERDIISGLKGVRWPGRFERLRKKPVFLLDGAHNPHGIAATVKSLKQELPDRKIVFLTGVMADKDVKNMFPQLVPLAKRFITVSPDNPRAMDADEYAKLLKDSGLDAISADTIEDGVKMAVKEAGEDGAVCALGSLYFSQDVREAVEKLDI